MNKEQMNGFGPTVQEAGTTLLLARYLSDGVVKTGLVQDRWISEIDLSWTTALNLLADGDNDVLLEARRSGRRAPLDADMLLPPLDPAADVYCVGLNYFEHQQEAGDLVDRIADDPIIFAKSPRAIAAPYGDLILPHSTSSEFDWEVELGVVIGRDSAGTSAYDAWDLVAGYCVVNDITARDLQVRHQQWHLGKNIPRSTPIGPWVAGRSSLRTPPDVELSLSVNGVEKQKGRSSQLIHSIPLLIELLSSVVSLRAGDIIATGTPSGVGFKRQPPEFLEDGDVMTAAIGGVGSLTNVVRTSTQALTGKAGRAAELV
jgi:2-keto-4-pentenoate hydratase/2-oxohepta-3-ene-1,7-dioic acid hydratase in catechol pathway